MLWPFNRRYPERCAEDVHNRYYDYIVIGDISQHLLPVAQL